MKKSEIFASKKSSVVLLDLVVPQGPNQSKMSVRGSGFIVSKSGYFVTCSHVYNEIPADELQHLGAKVISNTDEKGITHYESLAVELVDIDKENDLALMKLVDKGAKKVEFVPIGKLGNSEDVKEGDEVLFMGYPLATELLSMGFGVTLSANECIISSVKRRSLDGSLHFFMVDTHINNGSSGSPVFSAETGEVIGVAAGKVSSKIPQPSGEQVDVPANIGICRPSKYIFDILKKNKI